MTCFWFLFLFLFCTISGREWSVEELKKLEIHGIKRLIKMRNQTCENCVKKNDYIKKLLKIQHIEPEVTYKNPNTADTLLGKTKEQDLGLIMTDPIFLKYDDRKKRFELMTRLQAMGYDTNSITTIPASNRNVKKRRDEFIKKAELEGDEKFQYMKDYFKNDVYDRDEDGFGEDL